MFKLVLLPTMLILTSCNNLKDHPADCGEILECSDGSFDYDGDGYCANDCNDDTDYYDCDDIVQSVHFIEGCDFSGSLDTSYYVGYCDEDESRQLYCGADSGHLKDYVKAHVVGYTYDEFKDALFDCCDKESDLGCERGTEPVCQYPVNLGDLVFECGPDDECSSASDVNYRTPF